VFPEDLIESAQADVRGAKQGENAVGTSATVEPVEFEPLDTHFVQHVHGPPQRLWLHALLFVATLFTTTLVGAHMMYNFSHNLPFYDVADLERLTQVFTIGLQGPASFLSGLPFSLTLLTILMAHELGHYIACVWYGVDATLPFFLPSPMPVTGTFGAFIRIRSHIPGKRVLFDIGVAGPLAGFVFLVPALLIGLAWSRVLPGINTQGTLQLGVPALQWLAQKLIGHIVYALFGRAHKWITGAFLIALLPMGRFWNGWWLWAVLLFFFARKHPPVYDQAEVGAGRIKLGVVALIIFLLCFTIAPIRD
jgi:hypothetical protein